MMLLARLPVVSSGRVKSWDYQEPIRRRTLSSARYFALFHQVAFWPCSMGGWASAKKQQHLRTFFLRPWDLGWPQRNGLCVCVRKRSRCTHVWGWSMGTWTFLSALWTHDGSSDVLRGGPSFEGVILYQQPLSFVMFPTNAHTSDRSPKNPAVDKSPKCLDYRILRGYYGFLKD